MPRSDKQDHERRKHRPKHCHKKDKKKCDSHSRSDSDSDSCDFRKDLHKKRHFRRRFVKCDASCHSESESFNKCFNCERLELDFCAKLDFCQELVLLLQKGNSAKELPPVQPKFAPRPADEAPKRVHGKILLSFDHDLCKVRYCLFVFNACGRRNPNEKVTQAHLHAGRANENGPVVAFLANFTPLNKEGVDVDGLIAKGCLTNEDILPVSVPSSGYALNSIASLYDAIRRGEIYTNVHGSDFKPQKITYEQGLIRGQVFAARTTA